MSETVTLTLVAKNTTGSTPARPLSISTTITVNASDKLTEVRDKVTPYYPTGKTPTIKAGGFIVPKSMLITAGKCFEQYGKTLNAE
ncbi:hypothetical protein H4S06_006189 [Coemansia sp. BCRC 34490]|nr:hypothetical protein H4S06_006189 [Coemansia sp. BCRC 34490]